MDPIRAALFRHEGKPAAMNAWQEPIQKDFLWTRV